MSYKIRLLAERRLSMKIIAGKARRTLPAFMYGWLLHIRYVMFRRRCTNARLPEIRYSDGSWTQRKTTADLRKIEAVLAGLGKPLSVLQVGIGNSSLYGALKPTASRLVGITISEDEINHAKTKFPEDFGAGYQVALANKYSGELSSLGNNFDYIIDNDLSSYACCRFHFEAMLDGYRNLLAPNGAVLVGLDGLGYFDSGFGLTPGMIAEIASRHGLAFMVGENCHFLHKA